MRLQPLTRRAFSGPVPGVRSVLGPSAPLPRVHRAAQDRDISAKPTIGEPREFWLAQRGSVLKTRLCCAVCLRSVVGGCVATPTALARGGLACAKGIAS